LNVTTRFEKPSACTSEGVRIQALESSRTQELGNRRVAFAAQATRSQPLASTKGLPKVEAAPLQKCVVSAIVRSLFVKLSKILLLSLGLSLLGCANSERVENRDYAFDTYYPTPNEIQLAQQRAQRYWQKNSRRFTTATKYLAVYTTSVVQGDVNQDLYSKSMNSETTSRFFETYSSLNASCMMIYDPAANKFVSNFGYASVDLPPHGSVARWDGYTARYIGWGG
jgi:hypothetical protein